MEEKQQEILNLVLLKMTLNHTQLNLAVENALFTT